MKIIFALLLALAVGACQSQPNQSQAKQTLENIRTGYLVANIAIVGYSALRPCGEGVTGACKDLNLSAQLLQVIGAARLAIDTADTVIATAGTDATTTNKVLQIASDSVAAAVRILQQNRLG